MVGGISSATWRLVSGDEKSRYPAFSFSMSPEYQVLREREFILRQALESSGNCVFVWNLQTRNIELTLHELLQLWWEGTIVFSQAEWLDLVHPDDREAHKVHVRSFIKGSKDTPFNRDYRVRIGNGEYIWINTRWKVELDSAGLPFKVMWRHADIQYRKDVEEQIRYRSRTDGLTGLLNREAIFDILTNLLSRNKNSITENKQKIAVLIIDLDGFKKINDTYWHGTWDEILKQVSERLRLSVRASDTVARLWWDEFAIILPQIHEKKHAAKIARNIIKALRGIYPVSYHGMTEDINLDGCSIGISFFPDHGKTTTELVWNADAAMYEAKRNPGKWVRIFDEDIHRELKDMQALKASLKEAIERGEWLFPVYQPIIDRFWKIVSMEVLIRWKHPERWDIPPSKFIPLAEEMRLIWGIGKFMIQRVCEQMLAWKAEGYDYPNVAINVSAHQLTDGELVHTFEKVCRETGVLPEKITVELTESAIIQDIEKARNILEQLRKLWMRISIDDFWTGQSNMAALANLPIDTIKIDRTFVSRLTHDKSQITLCWSIILLAHSLWKDVVAEWVETTEQRDILMGLRCDKFQGYLISKPIVWSKIPEQAKTIETEMKLPIGRRLFEYWRRIVTWLRS